MSKIPFDLTTWNRKEHFHHYLNTFLPLWHDGKS